MYYKSDDRQLSDFNENVFIFNNNNNNSNNNKILLHIFPLSSRLNALYKHKTK